MAEWPLFEASQEVYEREGDFSTWSIYNGICKGGIICDFGL